MNYWTHPGRLTPSALIGIQITDRCGSLQRGFSIIPLRWRGAGVGYLEPERPTPEG